MVLGSLGHVISIGYDGRTSGGFIGTATCEGIGIPAPGGPVTSVKRARHPCYRASRMESEELASLGETTGIRKIHSRFYEGPAGRKGERGVRKSSHHLTKHTPVGKTRSLRATFRGTGKQTSRRLQCTYDKGNAARPEAEASDGLFPPLAEVS